MTACDIARQNCPVNTWSKYFNVYLHDNKVPRIAMCNTFLGRLGHTETESGQNS